jgi:hypothetical protein
MSCTAKFAASHGCGTAQTMGANKQSRLLLQVSSCIMQEQMQCCLFSYQTCNPVSDTE